MQEIEASRSERDQKMDLDTIKTLRKKQRWRRLAKSYQLQLFMLLPLIYIVIFKYVPMYGVQIAFKDFISTKGIWGSPWVGFKYFVRFYNSPQFKIIITNTLALSFYSLVAGFPFPILLALAINTSTKRRFKKIVQTVTYMPNFISTVVMVGMLLQFLSPRFGILNGIIKLFGGEDINFMAKAGLFRSIYVWSGIWQATGWGSIIYIASLSSVDPSLHEAAIVDGASRIRRVWHIDLPTILPTITIVLILNLGSLINVGFEKVFLMQNSLNLAKSEIISTYVYKVGLVSALPDYSYSTAIGLFNAIVSLILLVSVNRITRKLGGASLW